MLSIRAGKNYVWLEYIPKGNQRSSPKLFSTVHYQKTQRYHKFSLLEVVTDTSEQKRNRTRLFRSTHRPLQRDNWGRVRSGPPNAQGNIQARSGMGSECTTCTAAGGTGSYRCGWRCRLYCCKVMYFLIFSISCLIWNIQGLNLYILRQEWNGISLEWTILTFWPNLENLLGCLG